MLIVRPYLNSWKIDVYDSNRQDSVVLSLYDYQMTGLKSLKDLAPNQIDAEQLGNCACWLLDRYPGRLNEESWSSSKVLFSRNTIEFLALDLWSTNFDYWQLSDANFKPEGSGYRRLGQFHRAEAEVKHPTKNMLALRLPLCYDGIQGQDNRFEYTMRVHVRSINWTRLAEIDEVPENFIHRIKSFAGWPSGLTDQQKDSRKLFP